MDDETDKTGHPAEEKETVNLFTVSALRLHRTCLPPTPGKEPSLMTRLKRLVRTASRYIKRLKG